LPEIASQSSKFATAFLNQQIDPDSLEVGDLVAGQSLYSPPDVLSEFVSTNDQVFIYGIPQQGEYQKGELVTCEVIEIDKSDPQEIYLICRLISKDE